jgi:hypothetical protein
LISNHCSCCVGSSCSSDNWNSICN